MAKEIKADISLTDPAFGAEQTLAHTLAIELSWNRLAYAIYDNERSKYVALESYSTGKILLPGQLLEQIGNIIESVPFLKYSYKKIRIIWEGSQYTLVPVELYDEKQSAYYIQFTQTLQAGSSVCSDKLKNLNAINVYAIPSVIREHLSQIYPGHQLNHYLTILAESLLIANKNGGNEIRIFANVSSQWFDLIILEKGKLLFCNTFEYRSAEDFLYFLLFSFEQLKISPETATVTLIGDILRPSAIYDLLLKYVRETNFIQRNKAWDLSFVFNDLPSHFYYSLLNVLTCE